MPLKKLSQTELLDRIAGLNDFFQGPMEDDGQSTNANCVANVIGGELIGYHKEATDSSECGHTVDFIVIKDPEYYITNEQLCQIFDEGNHCLSRGSIIYEQNFAYITWSNLGHI
jgi:hypothetical protein